MEIKLKAPIGRMAIVTDEASRTAAVLDVDRIAIISIVVNGLTGVAQFALAFGGHDAAGRFHLDPSRADSVAHIVIRREAQPEQFDAWFRDEAGNPRMNYPESFFVSIVRSALLEAAFKVAWGGKFPDLEVLVDGESALKAERGRLMTSDASDAEQVKGERSEQ